MQGKKVIVSEPPEGLGGLHGLRDHVPARRDRGKIRLGHEVVGLVNEILRVLLPG